MVFSGVYIRPGHAPTDVAVKFLAGASQQLAPELFDSFLAEARLHSQLVHPNIIQQLGVIKVGY